MMEMNTIASATDPSVRVRMPKKLQEILKLAAKRNGRSANSEIIVRLAKTLAEDEAQRSGG